MKSVDVTVDGSVHSIDRGYDKVLGKEKVAKEARNHKKPGVKFLEFRQKGYETGNFRGPPCHVNAKHWDTFTRRRVDYHRKPGRSAYFPAAGASAG
jgi:hypothetical protein